MSSITIYTQNDCPPCTFVKNYLSEHHVNYEEKILLKINTDKK